MWLIWIMVGIVIGVGLSALLNMMRDPITREQAGVKPNKDEINGEEW